MSTKNLIAATTAILFVTLACSSLVPTKKAPEPPTEVYLGLRNIWFATTPEQVGIKTDPGSKVPYAVVMDIGLGNGSATIVSSIAGDGSMYISPGGGIIGGINHETVRKASIKFVQVAKGYVEKAKLVTSFALPTGDKVIFYFVTPSGVYATAEADPNILVKGDQELSALFLAGNDVITELRLINGK